MELFFFFYLDRVFMKIFLKNYIYAEAQIQETLVLHRLRVKAFCAERRVYTMGKFNMS